MREITQLIKSFEFAFSGLTHAIKDNRNLRIQIGIAVLVILASILFDVSPFEMGILGVMIILVLVCEMINTAIEEMVNLITQEHRAQAKIAKDVGAGMVLVVSMGSLVVGFLIFIPYILRLLGRH